MQTAYSVSFLVAQTSGVLLQDVILVNKNWGVNHLLTKLMSGSNQSSMNIMLDLLHIYITQVRFDIDSVI